MSKPMHGWVWLTALTTTKRGEGRYLSFCKIISIAYEIPKLKINEFIKEMPLTSVNKIDKKVLHTMQVCILTNYNVAIF